MAVELRTDSDSGSLQKKDRSIQGSDLKGNEGGEYYRKTASVVKPQEDSTDDDSSLEVKEVFDVQGFDPVLAKKMALVNKAIDDIGMTNLQWKMFFLNGFGYAVDSVSDAVQ